jgi:hypothetical protein
MADDVWFRFGSGSSVVNFALPRNFRSFTKVFWLTYDLFIH